MHTVRTCEMSLRSKQQPPRNGYGPTSTPPRHPTPQTSSRATTNLMQQPAADDEHAQGPLRPATLHSATRLPTGAHPLPMPIRDLLLVLGIGTGCGLLRPAAQRQPENQPSLVPARPPSKRKRRHHTTSREGAPPKCCQALACFRKSLQRFRAEPWLTTVNTQREPSKANKPTSQAESQQNAPTATTRPAALDAYD